MSEQVDIILVDKIPTSIGSKLSQISDLATKGAKNLSTLNKALAALKSNPATQLAAAISKVSAGLNPLSSALNKINTHFETFNIVLSTSAGAVNVLQRSLVRLIATQESLGNVVRAGVAASETDALTMLQQARSARTLAASLEAAVVARKSLTTATEQGQVTQNANVGMAGASGSANFALAAGAVGLGGVAAALSKVKTELRDGGEAYIRNRNSLGQWTKQTEKAKAAAKELTSSLKEQSTTVHHSSSNWIRALKWIGVYEIAMRTLSALGTEGQMRAIVSANVTDSIGQTQVVLGKIFDIAERTRAPVDAATTAFVRFDMALRHLGAGYQESLRFTETFSKAVALSGAGAQEMRTALIQFSQALNKGKLDGDEFRTVMETTPIVMDAIARQMGLVSKSGEVLRGRLLELAPQGKITADIMRKAIAGAADEIDAKFKKMPITIGQAMTLVSNRFTKMWNDIETSSGLMGALARSIEIITRDIPSLVAGLATATTAYMLFNKAIAANMALSIKNNNIGVLQAGVDSARKLIESRKESLYNASNAAGKAAMDRLIAERDLAVQRQANAAREARERAELAAQHRQTVAPLATTRTSTASKAAQEAELARQTIINARTELDSIKAKSSAELAALTTKRAAAVDTHNVQKQLTAAELKTVLAAKRAELGIQKELSSSVRAAKAEQLTATKRVTELENSLATGQALNIAKRQREVAFARDVAAQKTAVLVEQEALLAASRNKSATLSARKVAAEEALSSTRTAQALATKELNLATTTASASVVAAETKMQEALANRQAVASASIAAQTKAENSLNKAMKTSAKEREALIKQQQAAYTPLTTAITANTKAEQEAAKLIQTSRAELNAANLALAKSQAALDVAQRGFFARMAYGLKDAALAVGKFVSSGAGIAAIVAAAGLALAYFSDKITVTAGGAKLIDAAVVHWRDFKEAIDDTVSYVVDHLKDWFDLEISIDKVVTGVLRAADSFTRLKVSYEDWIRSQTGTASTWDILSLGTKGVTQFADAIIKNNNEPVTGPISNLIENLTPTSEQTTAQENYWNNVYTGIDKATDSALGLNAALSNINLQELNSYLRQELINTQASTDGAQLLFIAQKATSVGFNDINLAEKNLLDTGALSIDQLMRMAKEFNNLSASVDKAKASINEEVSRGPYELAGLEKARQYNLQKIMREGAGKWAGDFRYSKDVDAPVDWKRVEALDKVNLKLDDEIKRYGMLAEARQVQEKFDHIEEALKSKQIELSAAEAAAIKGKIAATVTNAAMQSKLDSIYSDTIGKQKEYNRELAAQEQMLKRGITTNTYYANSLREIGVKQAQLKLEMGDGSWSEVWQVTAGKFTEGFKNNFDSLSKTFTTFTTSFSDGFTNAISRAIAFNEKFGDSIKDVARNALVEFMNAIMKAQIQALVLNAISNSSGGGWMSSIFGGSSGWGASVVPAGAAYASGGYTGSISSDRIAGVVHGQEYVFNAEATRRLGVGTLDAMQRGASVGIQRPSAKSTTSTSGVVVNIENYGTNKAFEVEQISSNEVRIIARDEANRIVAEKSGDAIAAQLSNPNSKVSKALVSNTSASRRR